MLGENSLLWEWWDAGKGCLVAQRNCGCCISESAQGKLDQDPGQPHCGVVNLPMAGELELDDLHCPFLFKLFYECDSMNNMLLFLQFLYCYTGASTEADLRVSMI